MVGLFVCWLFGWLFGWLNGWLNGWLFVLFVWLNGWLVGWLKKIFVGWLINRLFLWVEPKGRRDWEFD